MKISRNATIGSIILGFIFVFLGILNLIYLDELNEPYNLQIELCILSGLVTIIWGVIMILFGYLQLKDIKKGKEFEVPDKIMR